LTKWGRRKDGQAYPKGGAFKINKSGSTRANGMVLPSQPSLTKNPFNTTKWSTAVNKYERFANNTKLKAYSYDPDDGIGYDLTNEFHAQQFYEKFNFPHFTKKPLYLVSLTNQVGRQLTRELHSNYLQAKNLGYSPLIGHWTEDDGREYTDITIAINGTNKEDALRLAKNQKQEQIMVIYNNGDYDFIDT